MGLAFLVDASANVSQRLVRRNLTSSIKVMPTNQPVPGNLNTIQRFVVLMLENRSFDHLVGYLRSVDSRVAGIVSGGLKMR